MRRRGPGELPKQEESYHSFAIKMTSEDLDKLTANAQSRVMSKSAYIRWMIQEDADNHLIHLTAALENLVTMMVEAIGGGIALIGAEAERTIVEPKRWGEQ